MTPVETRLRIQRFDPDTGLGPRWESFVVPSEPRDRVLDALHHIKWYIDGSLTFRRSCAHGVCGSDAMQINGINRLACKTLIADVRQPIRVAPLRGLPVKKDLVVDMEPFFAQYRRVAPYLIGGEPPPDRERVQSPEERARYDDATKCILCAACTTACPVFQKEDYIGPAAVVAAHRFVFDSRDRGAAERLGILGGEDGAFKCRRTFACTDACPRGIRVTERIDEVKREISSRSP